MGPPRYEQLSQSIERAIREGRLNPGDRLPPVRQWAESLAISVTTVTAAFDRLSERKLIRAEVGRGTFVAPLPVVAPARAPAATVTTRSARQAAAAPWRRRSLMTIGARLRARYPDAMDCSTGRPDITLLPLKVLRRAWATAIRQASAADLQYAGPDVLDALARPLVSLLEKDGVAVRAEDLVIGSSAQQWMMISLDVAASTVETESGSAWQAAVAVEEPGYPTIMDAYERVGAKLLPVTVDEQGAVPESLDAAFRAGAVLALLTPRAHNPTGATWTPERRTALAAVIADHPGVLVLEDDQFADVAGTRPGSLLSDARIGDRVIYVRSFSKSIAPDLRVAAAAARPRLRAYLAEAKSFGDGWTSRLLQHTLAAALADEELGTLLAHAREAYAERRARAAEALNGALQTHGGWTRCAPDGLNLWVHLPPGVDATEVVEKAAAAGVRVAPGEPFFIRPGRSDVVRLNAGSAPAQHASAAGRGVADAALASRSKGHSLIHV